MGIEKTTPSESRFGPEAELVDRAAQMQGRRAGEETVSYVPLSKRTCSETHAVLGFCGGTSAGSHCSMHALSRTDMSFFCKSGLWGINDLKKTTT